MVWDFFYVWIVCILVIDIINILYVKEGLWRL